MTSVLVHWREQVYKAIVIHLQIYLFFPNTAVHRLLDYALLQQEILFSFRVTELLWPYFRPSFRSIKGSVFSKQTFRTYLQQFSPPGGGFCVFLWFGVFLVGWFGDFFCCFLCMCVLVGFFICFILWFFLCLLFVCFSLGGGGFSFYFIFTFKKGLHCILVLKRKILCILQNS